MTLNLNILKKAKAPKLQFALWLYLSIYKNNWNYIKTYNAANLMQEFCNVPKNPLKNKLKFM